MARGHIRNNVTRTLLVGNVNGIIEYDKHFVIVHIIFLSYISYLPISGNCLTTFGYLF